MKSEKQQFASLLWRKAATIADIKQERNSPFDALQKQSFDKSTF